MSSTPIELLFSPDDYLPIEEEVPDYTWACAYVIVDWPLPESSEEWAKQIKYAGQISEVNKQRRWQVHQQQRKEETKNAKMITVQEFEGPEAETNSLVWERILFQYSHKMGLWDGIKPGSDKAEKTVRAKELARKASPQLRAKVVECLTRALHDAKNGKTTEKDHFFVCKEEGCGHKSNCASDLRTHKKKHMPLVHTFHCPQCNQGFSRNEYVARHIKTIHENQKRPPQNRNKMKCPRCNHQMDHRGNLRKHLMAKTIPNHGLDDKEADKLLNEVFGPPQNRGKYKRPTFASGSTDNIKLWKLPNGEFMQNLSGQNTMINSLAINEDGVIISGGDVGTMHFWDFKSGFCFQKEHPPPQPGSIDSERGIFALCFDKSGTRLITAEADKSIKMWKEDPEATEETHPLTWRPEILKKQRF